MGIYKREKAVEYANIWWNGHNPKYKLFKDDCTNFVSQCMHAGELPMVFGNKNSGWWYKGAGSSDDLWSLSWTVSHSLLWFLISYNKKFSVKVVKFPQELLIGDIIFYDFNGDDKWQHTTIVTSKNRDEMPLVYAHTVNSKFRYWDYRDSYAWSSKTRYKFIHISDIFN